MVEGELTRRLPLDCILTSAVKILIRVKALPLVCRHLAVLIFAFLFSHLHWMATKVELDHLSLSHRYANFLRAIYGFSFEEMEICLLFGLSADLSDSPNQTRQTDFVSGVNSGDGIDDFRTLRGIKHVLKCQKLQFIFQYLLKTAKNVGFSSFRTLCR